MEISLSQLREGQCGRIIALTMGEKFQRRLLDLGLIYGTVIRCVRKSPAGDPVLYCARGSMLALRNQDSDHIFIEEIL